MNPNQQPSMSPQGPPQMPPQQGAMQAIMGAGSSAQPANPGQAAQAGQGNPKMPQVPFSAAHHHIFNTLRNSLMDLVKQGVPGMEKVLAALNNAHVEGIKTQAQQPPQMPSQQAQIPPQVLAQLMGNQGGGMGQQPSPSAQMTPTMPQGGQ